MQDTRTAPKKEEKSKWRQDGLVAQSGETWSEISSDLTRPVKSQRYHGRKIKTKDISYGEVKY